MIELGIATDDKEVEASHLVHVVFRTTLGAYYTFPDMTQATFSELLQQLKVRSEQIIARNISGVMIVLPFRILWGLYQVGIAEHEEVHSTVPAADMLQLWVKA